MQIDFSYSYNCGHTTIDGVAWIFGWSSEYRCTLIRGVPAVILHATLLHSCGRYMVEAAGAVRLRPS
jgi:hypothetical protein